MLLIIENNEKISQYFQSKNEFLDITNLSLCETLKKLKDYKSITQIYFPLELKFKEKYRQNLQGLELFKHIRLTPDLENLQFVPILLGYTYPLDAILRNPESTILCSPATHLFHLKNIHQVNNSLFFHSKEKLTKEKIMPYILFTDTDEAKSEHDRRNEQGPLKLEKELNGITNSNIGLDLWQKKILFLQPETKTIEPSTIISNSGFKTAIKGKRILYLDDEAVKWEKPLKQLFDGATLDIEKDYKKIVAYFNELQFDQDKLRSNYTEIDRQLLQKFFTNGVNHEFILKKNEAIKIKSKLAELLNYDLILLDMRLDKDADQAKSAHQLSGVRVLNQIQELNPFIPVVMFTASNKIESYKGVIKEGAYDFWIKNVSSANDLKSKALNLLKNELQGKRLGNIKDVYAKYLMIKSRVAIYNHCTNDKKTTIDSEALSDLHRERINNSVWLFINFIQRFMSNDISNFDIDEFWKMTSDSIQIRVPAIYGLTEETVKKIDVRKKIDSKEFDFRWNRNYFLHSELDDKKRNRTLDPYDTNRIFDYINHSIDFLLDYR